MGGREEGATLADESFPRAVIAHPDAGAIESPTNAAGAPAILARDHYDPPLDPTEPDFGMAGALAAVRQQRRNVNEAARLERLAGALITR